MASENFENNLCKDLINNENYNQLYDFSKNKNEMINKFKITDKNINSYHDEFSVKNNSIDKFSSDNNKMEICLNNKKNENLDNINLQGNYNQNLLIKNNNIKNDNMQLINNENITKNFIKKELGMNINKNFNFHNSSNLNNITNAYINKSTTNNTRFSYDNIEVSKNNFIDNTNHYNNIFYNNNNNNYDLSNTINHTFSENFSNNKYSDQINNNINILNNQNINFMEKQKDIYTKRNNSLNPSILRNKDLFDQNFFINHNNNKQIEIQNSTSYNIDLENDNIHINNNDKGNLNKNQQTLIQNISNTVEENQNDDNTKNLVLNIDSGNSTCHFCSDKVNDNEIIYFCSCERIFHFNCLNDFLGKKNKTIHNTCDECKSFFKIFYFKLVENEENENLKNNYNDILNNASLNINDTENNKSSFNSEKINDILTGNSNVDENSVFSNININTTINLNSNNKFHNSVINPHKNKINFSNLDTNINNLDNYQEYCDLALKVNHECMSEIISKKEFEKNFSNINTPNSIGRIPLSPIPISNTPYTGKTRTKNVSSSLYRNSDNENESIKKIN